jgi:D-ornithine 4,5-aminomutase subunit beta
MEADAIMASTIISHDDIHYKNMQKLNDYAIEKGVRDKLVILAGGTQVTPELAVEHGMDAGFGRGTKGVHVATAIVQGKRRMRGEDE